MMHRAIGHILAVLLILALPVPHIDAYYCDDNLCSTEQFCCGENICCNYVNNTIWRFICLLISVIVFGFVLWGFIQLALAMISIYYSRNRPQDVEQNGFAAIGHDFSIVSVVKHFFSTFVQPDTDKPRMSKKSAASSTLISFNQANREQFN